MSNTAITTKKDMGLQAIGFNISDVSGNFTGTTKEGKDGWVVDADLSNPSLTIITGDFDSVTNGVSNGEAPSVLQLFTVKRQQL